MKVELTTFYLYKLAWRQVFSLIPLRANGLIDDAK
jgi:hypothetical protein